MAAIDCAKSAAPSVEPADMPALTDNTLIIIAVLMLLGGALIGIVLWLTWCARTPLDHLPTRDHYKSHWPMGIALVFTLSALYAWTGERDRNLQARIDNQARVQALVASGYFHPDRARLTVNLNDCPPRTDGMTDQVLMAIATQADGQHTITGCSRIAQRKYVVKH